MSFRPGGVTALAVFFIIIALLGGTIVIIISIVNISSIGRIAFYDALPIPLLLWLSGTPTETALFYAYLISYASYQPLMVIYYIVPVAAIVLVVIYLVAAVGLLRMRNWGRILALIMGALMIIGGVVTLIFIVGIVPLMLGIVIVWYLMTDVKYGFW